ncbi:hypothetical protein NQ317_005963 [Molorchus minor]|uniref:Glycoside hydrolase family 31 n=1 Tax=Molorchus minor TaxID=1323400 RepID=A0ABQ9JLV5_9CUCU|nr:hypothetical protein NQ317_005963 [Molorchus minor]
MKVIFLGITALLGSIKVNAHLADEVGFDVTLPDDENELGAKVTFLFNQGEVLSANVGATLNLHEADCEEEYNCQIGNVTLTTTAFGDNGYTITWESLDVTQTFKDCFNLTGANWFGGPQRYTQTWPLEAQILDGSSPYVIKKSDNFAVAERYWLNSKGAYIFIDDKVPLFVDQNNEEQGLVCFIAKAENPYINRTRVLLQYTVVLNENPKVAHLHAVNNVLGKPKGHPNEGMIREPIWTTWAKFKRDINDEIVLGFANDIVNNGFTGQVEIDEDWEVCFGAHVFKEDKFANINETVSGLLCGSTHLLTTTVRITLRTDLKKGYFVKNVNGNTTAIWWESEDAHQIDFTNPEAAEWFSTRIRALLTNPGVDGFKFDAGETDYAIPPSVYENVDQEEIPNCLTKSYIETCAEFGDLIEVRSAWRTQEYPFFVRMIDKDSVWGEDDGLYTLITTLLQMNMNGYTMVLPDMIGGNGYRQQPNVELLLRWTAANALMPAMQFSYLPWDFESDEYNATEIVRKFVKLHEDYADEIIKAMENSIENGTPVNPPIWWVDPTDQTALRIGDEFLLGENILVAPVYIENSTERTVYLPAGTWTDGNNGVTYNGPITILDYPAPIDVLPYFIKQ